MQSAKYPSVGDRVIHTPSGFEFIVTRRTRNRTTGIVELWADKISYPASECPLSPANLPDVAQVAQGNSPASTGQKLPTEDTLDRPLRPDELETLPMIVDCILAGDESVEMLSTLEPAHKAELWAALSEAQRDGLKKLRQVAKQPA